MKFLFFVLFFVPALAGHATGNTSYSCRQGRLPNGLGISSLNIEMSDEKPEAVMTVAYEFSTRLFSNLMGYEGAAKRFEFTPHVSSTGDVSVLLIKKKNRWIATVRSSTIDSFSTLECRRF